MRRDLILFSGGLDSTTLLAERVATGTAALAVSVDYGQRHVRELAAARSLAAFYGVEHRVLGLSAWGSMLTGSALTDRSVTVPLGHYADPSMAATVVPNRNATMLCAAGGVAVSAGCTHLLTAVHAGDHPVYPDCRPEFIAAIAEAVRLGTDGAVRIEAPYVNEDKAAIARRAAELGVPVESTWSCYEGAALHCGQCGTCVERREALGTSDPTRYAAVAA